MLGTSVGLGTRLELSHDIRYEKLPCHIEGMSKPLFLTLTGVCIEQVLRVSA